MGKGTAIQERPRAVETVETLEQPVCQHHWLIESPQGTMSKGRCKRCGEEKEFRNSATDHLWEDESGSGYNAWRGKRSTPAAVVADEEEVTASGVGSAALMV